MLTDQKKIDNLKLYAHDEYGLSSGEEMTAFVMGFDEAMIRHNKIAGEGSRQLEQRVSPPASQQVAELERKYAMMRDLCGHIIATVVTNYQRGSLVVKCDDQTQLEKTEREFRRMLFIWDKEFEQAG